MRNQDFCYWLQGYFEISKESSLTKEKIALINKSLQQIHEPLGDFTQWLSEVVAFTIKQECKPGILNFFLPEIRDRLNSIFLHVIDNSYETKLTSAECKKIHDGVV